MKHCSLVFVLLSAALLGCSAAEATSATATLNPLTQAKAILAFTCVHETIRAPSAESDVLFQYAQWLETNNMVKKDQTERLYRIAAENGHYNANMSLQKGSMRGYFKLRDDEHLRLSQNLIDAGVATGYYFIGLFLKSGSAGLEQDPEMARRYFRKAAERGNAQAQYDEGYKLGPDDSSQAIASQMYRCAAKQGHGEAALELGINMKKKGDYQKALQAFQLGVAAGNEIAALALEEGFRNSFPSNELYYLGQQEDQERVKRYKEIGKILSKNFYAKVPEINEIAPLPPAKLPIWDGKLLWLETRLADVPPEKPSEALIYKLASYKMLDPATGKPMSNKTTFRDEAVDRRPLG